MGLDSRPARVWFAALAATTALANGGSAFAQGATGNPDSGASNAGGADIVVTARRREERLQDVPISVAAYSAEDVEKKSLNDIQNVALATPNVNYAAGYTRGKAAGNLIIRGVGQTNTDTQFEAGVGIYLDGVYIASMQGVNLDLLDTERVEVLRGPQGTLFGKNTIGGALNIVSKRPDDQLAGKVEFTVGQRNRLQAKAQANIPIIPGSIDMRIGLASEQADGHGKVLNFATGQKIGDIGDRNRLSGRAMILFTVSDSFDALFSIDGRRIRETNTGFDLVGIQTGTFRTNMNNLLAARGLPLFDQRFVTASPYDTYGTGPNFYDVDAYNLSGTLTWNLNDDITIKSITAYRDLKVGTGVDFDGSPYRLIEQTVDWDQTQFSQEFQLGGTSLDNKLNWVMGLFYMDFKSSDFRFNNFGGEVVALGGTPDARSNSYANARTKSYAVFGQATYALTDQLNLTLGGRYSKDKRFFEGGQFALTNLNPVLTGGRGSWNAFSGTAALDYKITRDLMIYASAGRGYKGGIPENLRAATPQPLVDPEYITSYEIGFKSEFLDRKVRLNTALFYSNYDDLQLQIARFDPVSGRTTSFIANAAKVRIQGLETELDIYPLPGMSLNASYGYTDAKYKNFQPGVPFAITNDLVETPKHTLSLSGEYSMALGDSLNLVPRLDWSYKSALEHDLFNRVLGHQKGFGVLNGRVALESASGNWSLALFVTNITNKAYTVGSQNTTGAAFGMENRIYGDPRQWKVTASFKF